MTALLTVTDLQAGYRPDLPIIHHLSIDVYEHEIVTIIGPNGAGKSTLVKAIAGLISANKGKILFKQHAIEHLAAHQRITAGIAYVPQTDNIFTTLSIQQNLHLAAHAAGASSRARIEQTYQMFPVLAEKRKQKGRVLSGGQRQMLALAMALITSPSLIMLDEPTAGLAPKVVEDVFQHIRNLVQNNVSVLLVEQNAQAALKISDRAYVLAEGRNQLDGRADQLLADPMVSEIYLGTRRAS